MKKQYLNLFNAFLLAAGVTGAGNAFAQTPLTAGRLVVVQAGDGTAALSNSGNAVFLKEYLRSATVQAAPTQTVVVPTTGADRLVISGSATTEGLITLSADSAHLLLAGYDTSLTNTVSLPGSNSTTINRVVDTIGTYGVAGRAVSSTAFSSNNIRDAVKSSGNDYWAVGGTGGVQYLGNSAAATALGTTTTNIRALQIAGGNLYYSTTTGTTPGIFRIAGLPTVSGTGVGVSLVGTGSGSQPGDFAVNATETVIYVADGRTTAAGGIQKWVLTGGNWTLADTLTIGAAARALAVDWSAAFPTLYATTSDNRLVAVIDSNYAPGYVNTYVTIATAPSGTAFRGVAFTPKAAISCTAPSLSTNSTPASCTTGGSINLGVTGGSPVVSYFWTGPGGFTANTQNLTNLSPGTYSVVVTTVGGCKDSTLVGVAPPVGITAQITAATDTVFCQGESVVFSGNTGAGLSYQWLKDGAVIGTATASTFTAGVSGNYSVIVTDNSGCVDTSRAMMVTVKPLPTPQISYSGGQLTAQNAAAYTNFRWYLNAGTTPIATTPGFAPSANGSYTLRVDSNGCTGASSPFAVTDMSIASVTVNPFVVAPNPAKDAIEILPAAGYTVRITDLQGRTVLQGENTSRIRLSGLADGLYILHVRMPNGLDALPVKLLKQP